MSRQQLPPQIRKLVVTFVLAMSGPVVMASAGSPPRLRCPRGLPAGNPPPPGRGYTPFAKQVPDRDNHQRGGTTDHQLTCGGASPPHSRLNV
jgi:hypothetical protein